MLLLLCEERKKLLLYYSRISLTIAQQDSLSFRMKSRNTLRYLKFFKISGTGKEDKKNTTNVEALYASIPKWLITM